MNGPMQNCWVDLADAIVLRAVEDWRQANFNKLMPAADGSVQTDSKKDDSVIRSCERFFRSKYFENITELDGNTFLKRIKEGFGFQ